MTKQAVLAIVVGVLIVLGAVGAYFYSKNQTAKKTATVAVMHTTPTPNNAMQQSISQVLSSGKNSKCTFAAAPPSGGTQTSGTVYVSGQNARGDFEMTANGKTSTTHMIRVADTFYLWGDSLPVGMKMTMSVNDLASKMQGGAQANSFDPNKKVDFKCVTWTANATLFTPPTNVKFTSIQSPEGPTSMTHPTGSLTQTPKTSGNQNQCSICSSLTGNAKTACMNQFNCQ
jgi:hypothetical protein